MFVIVLGFLCCPFSPALKKVRVATPKARRGVFPGWEPGFFSRSEKAGCAEKSWGVSGNPSGRESESRLQTTGVGIRPERVAEETVAQKKSRMAGRARGVDV